MGVQLNPWLGILVSLFLYPVVWLILALLESGSWRRLLERYALR